MNPKYFSYETDKMLACPCCGDRGMVVEFLEVLDKIREDLGKPMVVSSGYRCAGYNAKISSTGVNGPHTTGRAVDILASLDYAYNLLELAIKYEIPRIGVSQNGNIDKRFIHLDMSKTHPTRRIWSY